MPYVRSTLHARLSVIFNLVIMEIRQTVENFSAQLLRDSKNQNMCSESELAIMIMHFFRQH